MVCEQPQEMLGTLCSVQSSTDYDGLAEHVGVFLRCVQLTSPKQVNGCIDRKPQKPSSGGAQLVARHAGLPAARPLRFIRGPDQVESTGTKCLMYGRSKHNGEYTELLILIQWLGRMSCWLDCGLMQRYEAGDRWNIETVHCCELSDGSDKAVFRSGSRESLATRKRERYVD